MKQQFGDRLYSLRKENGLTQDEFVEQINTRFDAGLNKSIVSRYENNIHKPARVTLVKQMSEYFGVTTDYLMGLNDEKYLGANKKDELKRIPVLESISTQITNKYEYTTDKKIDFCILAKDDSMVGARIFKDDLVYIRKTADIGHGHIGLISINSQEAMIRRVYKYGSKIVLHPENPTMSDETFSRNDKSISILGEVKYTKFEVR